MKFNITHWHQETKITEHQEREIYDLLSWKTTPCFITPGRTAWHNLKERITLNGIPYSALKLKGIGVWNPDHLRKSSRMQKEKTYNQPHPPTNIKYESGRQVKHFGFSKNGDYLNITSKVTPFGGIEHHRAVQEYEIALHLHNNQVSVTPPLLVIEYPDSFFGENTMGAVVSLVEESIPYRLDRIFQGNQEDVNYWKFYKNLLDDLMIFPNKTLEAQKAKTLQKVMEKIGSELFKFSFCGAFRHSGGLDNFYYCFRTHQVVFTDLDSSLFLTRINEKNRPLEILRDLISVMHKFLHHLSALVNKSSSDVIRELRKNDPVYALLRAYFRDVSFIELQYLSDILWDYFEDTPPHIWRSYHLTGEKDMFYIFCLIILLPLYSKTDLQKKYPNSWKKMDLICKSKKSLGERYGELDFLLKKYEKLNN